MSNGKSGTQLVLSTGFSSQCFPVRSLTRFKGQDDDGMWKCRSYSLLALKLVYNLLKIFVFSCLCKRKCSSVCCEVDFFSNDILCLQEILAMHVVVIFFSSYCRRCVACCVPSWAEETFQSSYMCWRPKCLVQIADKDIQKGRIPDYRRRFETTQTWWILFGKWMRMTLASPFLWLQYYFRHKDFVTTNSLRFVQMKKFHVEDPSDLCSIRISGQELREVK